MMFDSEGARANPGFADGSLSAAPFLMLILPTDEPWAAGGRGLPCRAKVPSCCCVWPCTASGFSVVVEPSGFRVGFAVVPQKFFQV